MSPSQQTAPLLQPFGGIRFADFDISSLVCPPYDIISPAAREALYNLHVHNAIRLEYPLPDECNDAYRAAAASWREWRQAAVLKEDAPAYYICRADFEFEGRASSRLGLFVALHLESLQEGRVKPHERTRPAAKADRLSLMRATKANFSPIWTVCHKPGLTQLLEGMTAGEPVSRAQTPDGIRYRLWAVTEAEATAKIEECIADGPILIADGHHRYETALTYAREHPGEGAPVNYLLAFLVEASDPGLHILPTHRAIGGLSRAQQETLWGRLDEHCEGRPLSNLDDLLAQAYKSESAFGVYTRERGCMLFSLKEQAQPDCRGLAPVSILHRCILDEVVNQEVKFGFYKNAADAQKAVDEGELQVAFFMRALTNREFVEAAQSRTRLPEKSTYFWPKIPAGLVMRSLEA